MFFKHSPSAKHKLKLEYLKIYLTERGLLPGISDEIKLPNINVFAEQRLKNTLDMDYLAPTLQEQRRAFNSRMQRSLKTAETPSILEPLGYSRPDGENADVLRK